MTKVKLLLVKILPRDWLTAFQWYREQSGGFWVRSNTFGWRQFTNTIEINWELALSRRCPDLYGYGKDIEDYRTIEEKQ